jgi:sortase A
VTPCVTYQYAVTGAHVVPAGSPVFSGPDGKLDLVTCYPLNALYLTPNRYVVEANLVNVLDAGRPVAVPPAYFVPWVPAPAPGVPE